MCPKDSDAPPKKLKRKLLALDADGDGPTDGQTEGRTWVTIYALSTILQMAGA